MQIRRLISKGLRATFQPPAITNSTIAKKSKVYSGTQVNDSSIEKYTYIGHDCFLLNAHIGPFCSIADNCRIGGATHTFEYVSSSPIFNKGKSFCKEKFANFDCIDAKKVIIGPDVWIGANCVLISGVSIGLGSVIGAGSVVTHDIPPYEIWAGNPAKKIRDRFVDDIKKGLISSGWWRLDDEKLKECSKYFNNPIVFIEKIKESDIL